MLDPHQPYKPLDFGNGLVAGCVNDRGRLTALNTYSPLHGYATLSSLPPFADDWRYDPASVRRYRASLAGRDAPAFGFSFKPQPAPIPRCSLETPAVPQIQFEIEPGVRVAITTFAPFQDEAPLAGALQFCHITNTSSQAVDIKYSWNGELRLARSSYAQLTEGGPLPAPPDHYQVWSEPQTVLVENQGLGLAVAIQVGELSSDPPGDVGQKPAGPRSWQARLAGPAGPVELSLTGEIKLAPGSSTDLAAAFGFGPDGPAALANLARLTHNPERLLETVLARWRRLNQAVGAALPEAGPARLVVQTLAYILGCCALPVSPQATCLLTDHQLLPLAWTRDTYYQAQALLALRRRSPDEAVRRRIERVIEQHLHWLFEIAERPHGYWGRAYLANGRLKDAAFQLDQQCYPLLEAVDYGEAVGRPDFIEPYYGAIEAVLDDLLARRAAEDWLFPTSETPADDRVEMPYHLSSQIVLWRALQRLAGLDRRGKYRRPELMEMAENLRQAVRRHLVAEYGGRAIFAYLTDLRGNHRFYHDANDWPTVLAAEWGFVTPDDPVWRATLDFAFSPANLEGYYRGRLAGLGSVHTPHPWPLGDIQELYLGRRFHDRTRQTRILARLAEVACWDGHLPEAYDEHSGQVASRHWFGWPGAMLVISLLDSLT